MKSIEELKTEKGTAEWLFNATKAAKRWGEGRELSDADYDAAVAETAGLKLHAYPPGAAVAPAAPTSPEDRASPVIDDRPAKRK